MGRNFGRAYRLAIRRDGVTKNFTEQRIQFRVQKFAGGENNVSVINVFNLPEDERNRLARPVPVVDAVTLTDRIGIFLHAGYGNDLGLLSRGAVKQVFSVREPTDWRTEFQIYSTLEQDFNGELKESWVNTQAITIVRALFKAWQYPNVKFTQEALDLLQVILPSYSVNGRVKRQIKKLLNRYELEFTVDEEGPKVSVRHVAFDSAKPLETLPLISEQTGMIGAPKITLTGAVLRASLSSQIADLYPMNSLVLESETTRQTFQNRSIIVGAPSQKYRQRLVVTEIDFVGDNREGDWLAEITSVYPGFAPNDKNVVNQQRSDIQ